MLVTLAHRTTARYETEKVARYIVFDAYLALSWMKTGIISLISQITYEIRFVHTDRDREVNGLYEAV